MFKIRNAKWVFLAACVAVILGVLLGRFRGGSGNRLMGRALANYARGETKQLATPEKIWLALTMRQDEIARDLARSIVSGSVLIGVYSASELPQGIFPDALGATVPIQAADGTVFYRIMLEIGYLRSASVEELQVTLTHEGTHVRQYRQGRMDPRSGKGWFTKEETVNWLWAEIEAHKADCERAKELKVARKHGDPMCLTVNEPHYMAMLLRFSLPSDLPDHDKYDGYLMDEIRRIWPKGVSFAPPDWMIRAVQ